MAARSRRKTEWYGVQDTLSLTGPSQGERTPVSSPNNAGTIEIPTPATIIRIRGNILTTMGRSASVNSTGNSQGARVTIGLMVEESSSASAASLDLADPDDIGDDRWMAVWHFALFASAIWAGYWNGTAQVDRWALTPDLRVANIEVDIKAKRRWVDPCKLTLHGLWSTLGDAPTSVDIRYLLRVLVATH